MSFHAVISLVSGVLVKVCGDSFEIIQCLAAAMAAALTVLVRASSFPRPGSSPRPPVMGKEEGAP